MHQLPWRKGASTRGRTSSTSQLCCTRANSAAQHAGQARTTTNPGGSAGGRAGAREPGELTRGASAELVRARKTFVAALVLAGNSTDAKGSEDRMTSPGANARSATTHSPRPGLRVVATWNRSLRYRSRASCRRGESAQPSGAPLARIGLPPAPQSTASSRAAAARRTIASTAVTTCALGCTCG